MNYRPLWGELADREEDETGGIGHDPKPTLADVPRSIVSLLQANMDVDIATSALGSIRLSLRSDPSFSVDTGVYFYVIAGNVAANSRLNEMAGLEAVMPAARLRLREMRMLGANWDGYGSPAPATRSLELAEEVLRRLENMAGAPPADIAPCGDGGVQFELRQGSRELHIYCSETGTLEFLRASPTENFEDEYEGDLAGITAAVTWLQAK